MGGFMVSNLALINIGNQLQERKIRKTEGTPLSLRHAIENGLQRASEGEVGCGCPHCEKLLQTILEHNVDFLAQKFGAAYLRASEKPETLKALEVLWEAVKRDAA